MLQTIPIDEITRVIGISTAPAFLLGALVGMLSLLVGRFGRISDKAGTFATASGEMENKHRQVVSRRLGYNKAAITLCVFSAVATSLMVNLVFVDTLFGLQNNRTIVLMFIAAIVLFTVALIFFLLEIMLSSRTPGFRDV